MDIKSIFKSTLPTIVLLVLDIMWITFYMGPQYKIMVPKIQGSEMQVNLWYPIAAYLLMVMGLYLFVLPNVKSSQDALVYGGLFGTILYGVYDFTAGTVFKSWDLKLALIDVAWGAFVYYIASMSKVKFQ